MVTGCESGTTGSSMTSIGREGYFTCLRLGIGGKFIERSESNRLWQVSVRGRVPPCRPTPRRIPLRPLQATHCPAGRRRQAGPEGAEAADFLLSVLPFDALDLPRCRRSTTLPRNIRLAGYLNGGRRQHHPRHPQAAAPSSRSSMAVKACTQRSFWRATG